MKETLKLESEESFDSLLIRFPRFIVIGICTAGIYWAFFIAQWSRKHLKIRNSVLEKDQVNSAEVTHTGNKQRSRRTVILSSLSGILAVASLVFLIFDSPSGIIRWASWCLLGFGWASLLFEMRFMAEQDMQTFEQNKSSGSHHLDSISAITDSFWFLKSSRSDIIYAMLIFCIPLLSPIVLVFLIFVMAVAINSFVKLENIVFEKNTALVTELSNSLDKPLYKINHFYLTLSSKFILAAIVLKIVLDGMGRKAALDLQPFVIILGAACLFALVLWLNEFMKIAKYRKVLGWITILVGISGLLWWPGGNKGYFLVKGSINGDPEKLVPLMLGVSFRGIGAFLLYIGGKLVWKPSGLSYRMQESAAKSTKDEKGISE